MSAVPTPPIVAPRASFAADPDEAVAFHATEATRLEALILRCCAQQIAAAAGPGARPLIVLPPDSIRASSPNEVVRTLNRIGESHADDVLLVVGAALPPSRGRFAAPEAIDVSASYRYSVPRFESLAASAGWQHCQLWSDAQARYAVHVLERNTHVTET